MAPTPEESAALLQRCRELLSAPTCGELTAEDEFERTEAALAAAQRGLLLEMLETGDPNTRSPRPLPSRWSFPEEEAGCTLLFLLAPAAKAGIDNRRASLLVKWLLQAGADPLAAGAPNGRHPLHQHIVRPHVARRLLDAGADANVRDAEGKTPLFYDFLSPTMKLLVERGADVRARDAQGSTVLHRPLYLCWAQPLIEHGADIHAEDAEGQTPFFFARDAATARYLVAQGVNPLHRDKQGRSPLFAYALEAEHLRFLVELGCDPNARDAEGHTPLHVTACAATAKLLLELGADVNARNAAGRTPLAEACSKRVAALLRAAGGVR